MRIEREMSDRDSHGHRAGIVDAWTRGWATGVDTTIAQTSEQDGLRGMAMPMAGPLIGIQQPQEIAEPARSEIGR